MHVNAIIDLETFTKATFCKPSILICVELLKYINTRQTSLKHVYIDTRSLVNVHLLIFLSLSSHSL